MGGGRRIIALDTETTGVDPVSSRIVELAMVELDEALNPLGSFVRRINPGIPIPDAATAVHGITDADVAHESPFSACAGRIQRHLEGTTLIAYNGIRFDLPLLDEELRRAGQPGIQANHPVIDPYRLFLDEAPHTLTGACQYYLGHGHEGAHAALADVEAMLEVLRVQALRRGHPLGALAAQSERNWLDLARTMYHDEDGVARFGFGKWKHEPCQTHQSYLEWMLASGFTIQTKDVIRDLLRAASQ